MNEKQRYFDDLSLKWDGFQDDERDRIELPKLMRKIGLEPGDKILEVGCGTGRLIPYLVSAMDSNGLIAAFDYAPGMILKAREKFNFNSIKFFIADAENLPIIDDVFDTVICFSAFPHFDDQAKALLDFIRVLKPNGKLIIAHLSSRDDLNQFHSLIDAPVKGDRLADESEMKKSMEDAGFYIISLEDNPGLYLLVARLKAHSSKFDI